MKISAKGRYAIASVISIAQTASLNDCVTIISLSQTLGISKIYLEQVFSLLKRGGLVVSIKGAQGGYQLSRQSSDISVYDILLAVENGLFEVSEETVKDTAPEIETAIHSMVFTPFNNGIVEFLKSISLQSLVDEANRLSGENSYMYYL